MIRASLTTSCHQYMVVEKQPMLAMEAVLCCAQMHHDRASLGALASTLAPRFLTRSWRTSACIGTFSTELCQIQLEKFARAALISSRNVVQLLQRPQLIAHPNASARACDLHVHVSCSMASMRLIICC